MSGHEQVVIDRSLCTGCGACVTVCPVRTLSLVEGVAAATGQTSIGCGHCEAVCPEGAIRIPALSDDTLRWATFTPDAAWLPHGKYDTSGLVRLMASRRSCRNYSGRPVERPLLEDLVKIGITAPSGTNSQGWTFTLVPSREAVLNIGTLIASFFMSLNKKAANPLLRAALRIAGRRELDDYYRSHFRLVQEALDDWERVGTDRLFHGATAAIIVGSRPGASTPSEDALLATQNILLAAHSMGLGSCLIGYVVAAMREDRTIQRALGVPAEEEVHAVIALGYPDETYHSQARRRKPPIRYYEGLR